VSSTGAIYFTTQDPATFKLYLTALNAAGSLQWQLNFPCCGGFTPAIAADGTIFLGTGQGLWAVNPDGSMKWQFRTDLVFGVPTIGGDGTIYAPVSGGTIFMAVNSNGTLKWTSDDWSSVDACGAFVNEPAIGPDGTIYLIPENDGIAVCNPNGPLLAFH
jgi:outer membrane protein assembly factor BamB